MPFSHKFALLLSNFRVAFYSFFCEGSVTFSSELHGNAAMDSLPAAVLSLVMERQKLPQS